MTNKHLFSRLLKKAISMALWMKAILCGKSSLLEQSLPRTPSRPILILAYLSSRSAISAFSAVKKSCLCVLVAINPFNQRNLCPRYPRLINDLRLFKPLYNCRETFTDVMSALQIKLFLQNEPKSRKVKLNVTIILTRKYDKLDTWSIGKNEPKTNPNEPKTNPNAKRPK